MPFPARHRPPRPWFHLLRPAADLGVLVAGTLGGVALIGWALPGFSRLTVARFMGPNAGLLLLLLALGHGAGLRAGRRSLGAALGGMIGLWALERLAEITPGLRGPLAGWTLDGVLFEGPGHALGLATTVARLSPLAAGAFAVTAAALVCLFGVLPLHRRVGDGLAAAGGVGVFAVSLGYLLSHAYGNVGDEGRAARVAPAAVRRPAPMDTAVAVGFLLLGSGLALTAADRDIVERRGVRRRRRAEHLVTRALATGTTVEEVAPTILATLCEGLDWSFGAFWRREGDELRCACTWRAGPELRGFDEFRQTLRFPRGIGIPGRVWATGWPEWQEHLAPGPDLPGVPAALAAGLHQAFAVPVRPEGGECLGALEFFHQDSRPPDGELLAMMMAVAAQLALFLRRVRAEAALARDHGLLRAVIDNLPDHISLKDTDGRYVVDNAAHTRFLGLANPEAIVGKTVFDFFPPELAGPSAADDRRVLAGGRPVLDREEPILAADGTPGFVATSKLPFRDASGQIVGLVCVSRDITAQRHAEAGLRATELQLIQAEKLESLGRLAAGIAHEVKNPLAVLTMGVDYLAGDLDAAGAAADPNTREILDAMRESVRRADAILREMLDFCTPRPLEPRPENLNDLVTRTLPLVRHEFDVARVQVEAHLEQDLPTVALDRDKILQVLINLFINAAHAMREHPPGAMNGASHHELTVRTSARTLGGEEAAGRRRRDEGRRRNARCRAGDPVVVLEVEDTGTGLPDDGQNVFDPFYTTKAAGKGTGLGLTVTRKIVELHDGEILLENRPDGRRGARVTIVFKALGPAGSPVGEAPTGVAAPTV